jgi:hypothetical protein
MRYLILAFFFYSYKNHICNPHSLVTSENLIDSFVQMSRGARIEFHHPTKKVSIVARKIVTRNQLDSLSTYIGSRSYDTSCFVAGVYNSYGQINLYRDTAMIDRVREIHFVLNGKCEGFYILTDGGLVRYNLTPEGERSLLSLKHKNANFLNK